MRAMVERDHATLSGVQQCPLLSISRRAFYYAPRGETVANLALLRMIDEQFLKTPFYGGRQMTWYLWAEGERVNPKRVRRLMRLKSAMPIYQRPKTSVPAKQHRIRPYLLRGRTIIEPNEAWVAQTSPTHPWHGASSTSWPSWPEPRGG